MLYNFESGDKVRITRGIKVLRRTCPNCGQVIGIELEALPLLYENTLNCTKCDFPINYCLRIGDEIKEAGLE